MESRWKATFSPGEKCGPPGNAFSLVVPTFEKPQVEADFFTTGDRRGAASRRAAASSRTRRWSSGPATGAPRASRGTSKAPRTRYRLWQRYRCGYFSLRLVLTLVRILVLLLLLLISPGPRAHRPAPKTLRGI